MGGQTLTLDIRERGQIFGLGIMSTASGTDRTDRAFTVAARNMDKLRRSSISPNTGSNTPLATMSHCINRFSGRSEPGVTAVQIIGGRQSSGQNGGILSSSETLLCKFARLLTKKSRSINTPTGPDSGHRFGRIYNNLRLTKSLGNVIIRKEGFTLHTKSLRFCCECVCKRFHSTTGRGLLSIVHPKKITKSGSTPRKNGIF